MGMQRVGATQLQEKVEAMARMNHAPGTGMCAALAQQPPLQMMPQVVMEVHEQNIAIVEVDWEGHGKKQEVADQIKQKYIMQYDCVCMCMCVAYMGWERWRMKVRPRPMWSQTRML
jgi:hypothetical protein